MSRAFFALVAVGLLALAGVLALEPPPAGTPAPAPSPWPWPSPAPAPAPEPDPFGPLRRLGPLLGASVGGRVAPDGAPLMIDLPNDRHQRNKAGRDGSGLCVFTSVGMAFDWANLPALVDFRDWMTNKPGGGYPAKLDAMVRAFCAERNQPVPAYLNVEAADLDLIDAALAAGYPVAATYNHSPSGRYGGQRIAHMILLVHGDPKGNGGKGCYAILDNNYPGADHYEYLTRAELSSVRPRWCVVVIGSPGPPPPPRPL